MKNLFPLFLYAALSLQAATAQTRQVKLTLLETGDVHGNYLPYDFINGQEGKGSLARVATYVDSLRQVLGRENVVLLDNGDILQGQPTAYYYNFIRPQAPHLCASVLNFMHYDALTVGNHDIETGHAVYDRWAAQCQAPVLGANVVDTHTGEPYWKPYVVLERQGVRIAVFGMLTPAIPQWLPENLWTGLRFDDLVETARKYMPEMRRQADVVVGLFHSGAGGEGAYKAGAENAAIDVAERVPGFSVIFYGHDHRRQQREVRPDGGGSVLLLNPANGALALARADLTLTVQDGKVTECQAAGNLVDVSALPPSPALTAAFAAEADSVRAFTDRPLGYNEVSLTTLPAFFGPSAFIDFIHQMQLSLTDADISFTAPLSFNARLEAGEVHVRDLFKLYPYENQLYLMSLTGQEVKDYLEYSYAGWTAQMQSAQDHLLRFRPAPEQYAEPWQRLATPSYNFDSAAGIRYTVDVTQPRGKKIKILSMADGSPFSLTAHYRCAVNSYRGNGGGGHLTEGAGIPEAELKSRILWATDKDLRFYLMTGIEALGRIDPAPLNLWKFVPEDWAQPAADRDKVLLQPAGR